MGLREWLLLVVLAALWGGSFFFSKIALAEVMPFTLVLSRVALAAITLLGFLLISGRKVPSGSSIWIAFFGMGLLNNVIPFSLLFWGQTQISASLASILNATTPIFTILVAHFLTQNERITPNRLFGIALGFVGVVVMLNADLSDDQPVFAMLACLGAALSYGFASVFGRRFQSKGVEPVQVAFGQLTASTVLMLPIVLTADPLIAPNLYSMTTILSVLVLALACTAYAYILFFRILGAGGAVNISLVALLVPVSAILLGSVFLSEQLMSHHYVGMSLIATGLLSIDGRICKVFLKLS